MTDPTNPKAKNQLKMIGIISNVAILANLLVGFLAMPIWIMPVFTGIHAVLRLNYLKIESESQIIAPNQTKTNFAPPIVRNLASVITAVLLSVILYGLGLGLSKLLALF